MGAAARRTSWIQVALIALSVGSVALLGAVILRPVLALTDQLDGCPPLPAHIAEGAPFDPLVRPVAIGFLPEQLEHRLTRITPDTYETEYAWGSPDQKVMPIATELELRVWRAGVAPWQIEGPAQVPNHAVDPINGGQAVWLPEAGLLRWELEPHEWAELRLNQTMVNGDLQPPAPFPPPSLETVRLVAESVRTEGAEPMKLPWRLPAPPAGVTLASVQVLDDPSDQSWRAELVFGYEDRPCPTAFIVRSQSASEGPADTYAVTELADDNGTMLLAVGRGARHEVFAAAPEPAGSIGPGGLRGYFERMEIFDDVAAWRDGTLPR